MDLLRRCELRPMKFESGSGFAQRRSTEVSVSATLDPGPLSIRK